MTPGTLRIRNWRKWQSYRSDRGQPPWIKVHRTLMRDPLWVGLTDAQRGQLVSIWLLAADRDGVIPASPALIRKLCFMDEEPDLEVFIAHKFIEPGATATPPRRQHDETETETETEKSREESSTLPSVSDLWGVWIEELGGKPPHPTLTATRSKKLRALAVEHLDEPGGLEKFRLVLKAVKHSDHHMSNRAYQMPDSLFVNAERRDTWVNKAIHGNGSRGVHDSRPLDDDSAASFYS